jgi:hypothetical protein
MPKKHLDAYEVHYGAKYEKVISGLLEKGYHCEFVTKERRGEYRGMGIHDFYLVTDAPERYVNSLGIF